MTATANQSGSPLRTPAEAILSTPANICRASAAAIGERTEFCPQANSTDLGFNAGSGAPTASALPMQHADEREQPPRGLEIDQNLALEALHQELGALVVECAAAHVERLDALRRRATDRPVIAVADDAVVLDQASQRRE